MASNPYLTENLLTAIRDSGMLPPADESAQTTRLLGFVNREQHLYLMRLLLSVREGYRYASVDIPIVSGTDTYRVPSRAVGASLKLVNTVDASGGLVEQRPSAHYNIRDNSLVFVESPAASGTLRLTYLRRFNKVVPATSAAEITAINTATRAVTVLGIPTTSVFTSSVLYDFIQGTPHFDTLGADLSATVAGSVLTFATALPTSLAVGDFVALAGETPICQAPVELHDVLMQAALVSYLESQGDAQRAAVAEKKREQMRADALSLLSPRVQDSAEVLINYNAPGWVRRVFRGR